jgi:hypothetical protein
MQTPRRTGAFFFEARSLEHQHQQKHYEDDEHEGSSSDIHRFTSLGKN